MRARETRWLMMAMVGFLFTMVATPALADVVPFECKQIAGLTHRMAGCIRFTIDNAAALYFNNFYGFVQKAITAGITLAVIVYGVLLSFGMVEKLGRDTFVLLIKIALITALVTKSDFMFKTITEAMDGAATAVVSFSPASGVADASGSDYTQAKCMKNMVEQMNASGNPTPAIAPWLGIDCLLDTIIGIKLPLKPGDPTPTFNAVFYNPVLDASSGQSSNSGMSRSLIYFFFSGFQSSIVGIVLAVVGFIFIFGAALLVVRCFFIYIAGYIGIALLVIVSPLFIPLVLFRQTKQYFDKWVKLLISFAMQPVLMLIFLIMTVTALDLAVFSGSYSIMYRIAGDASRQPNFDLNAYLTASRYSSGAVGVCSNCTSIITSAPKPVAQIKADANTPMNSDEMLDKVNLGGKISGQIESKCKQSEIEKDTTGSLKKACAFTYPVKFWLRSIDWGLMAAARTTDNGVATTLPANYPEVKDKDGNNSDYLQKGQFVMREVLAASFLCVMIVFIMKSLMAVVPTVIGGLLGDVGQSPNLTAVGNMGGPSGTAAQAANKAYESAGSFTQGMTNKISSMTAKR